jgi:hypothetical protein
MPSRVQYLYPKNREKGGGAKQLLACCPCSWRPYIWLVHLQAQAPSLCTPDRLPARPDGELHPYRRDLRPFCRQEGNRCAAIPRCLLYHAHPLPWRPGMSSMAPRVAPSAPPHAQASPPCGADAVSVRKQQLLPAAPRQQLQARRMARCQAAKDPTLQLTEDERRWESQVGWGGSVAG